MKAHRRTSSTLFIILVIFCFQFSGGLAHSLEEDYSLHLKHRINAHGDEYMAIALSTDGQTLIIGTEKGELLLWSISEQRIVRRFNQGSPIHSVIALGDGSHVLAGGGAHTGAMHSGVVRRWDIKTGTFEDWPGAGRESIVRLAYDRDAGFVAADAGAKRIIVWSAKTGQLVASWELEQTLIGIAVIGHTIYATVDDRQVMAVAADENDGTGQSHILAFSLDDTRQTAQQLVPQQTGRQWGEMMASPDGHLLAVRYYDANDSSLHIALLTPASGLERASFKGTAPAWIAPDRLLFSENDEEPSSLARINADGKVSIERISEGAKWHSNGSPTGLAGQAVSQDGMKVWAVYQLNAALVEWDLKGKSGQVLFSEKGFPYAMDVLAQKENEGLLITGGDDGFVRIWNLSDLSLRREFRVPFGVPQGVGLLTDGHHVVFSYSTNKTPTEIALADLDTGEQRKLLKLDQPMIGLHAAAGQRFVYELGRKIVLASETGQTEREFVIDEPVGSFAVSANGRWLAVADQNGVLNLFEIATGRRVRSQTAKIEQLSRIAVTNDGRHVYTTEWYAHLRRWETKGDVIKDLGGYRGQSAFLRLSADEKHILIGGNHRDIGVYTAETGEQVAYFETDASDFHVTNGWMRGNRLLFTTDAGVLFDGVLER